MVFLFAPDSSPNIRKGVLIFDYALQFALHELNINKNNRYYNKLTSKLDAR